MNRKRKETMDAAQSSIIRPFPAKNPALEVEGDESEKRRKKWWLPITNWVGLTMPNEQKPTGWSFNPATATLGLALAGTLLWSGYHYGYKDAEYKMLNDRLQKAEADAAEAKKFSIYATAGADAETGHKPQQKDKK